MEARQGTDLVLVCHSWSSCLPFVIQAGVLPYGEAIGSIANTLVALCLNVGGLQRVLQSRMLECFIPIFTAKK